MGYMGEMTDLGTVFGSGSSAGAAAGAFNPAAALGGMAAETASAWYNNRMAQKRQHESFDQQKWMMQNRYQMQVADMKAAGLNPMLATSQGAPMPSSVGQAPVKSPDYVAAMSQAMLSSAQAAKTNQETKNLEIENNNLQNAAKLQIKAMSRIDAEIDEIDSRIKQNKASKEEIDRRADLLRVQAMLAAQELTIKTPEAVASATEGAEIGAKIDRWFRPFLNAIGGAQKIYKGGQ